MQLRGFEAPWLTRGGGQGVFVINKNAKRDQAQLVRYDASTGLQTSSACEGRKAQLTNIQVAITLCSSQILLFLFAAEQAGKTVAGIVRTTLGPRAMLKMLSGAL